MLTDPMVPIEPIEPTEPTEPADPGGFIAGDAAPVVVVVGTGELALFVPPVWWWGCDW